MRAIKCVCGTCKQCKQREYQQAKRAGTFIYKHRYDKICSKCGVNKRHKTRSGNYAVYCKSCQFTYGNEKWHKRDKKEYNVIRRVNKHNISKEEFIRKFELQEGKCEICKRDIVMTGKRHAKNLAHLDHNHKTQVMRGVLCRGCNIAIGHFEENEQSMINAALYIRKYREV